MSADEEITELSTLPTIIKRGAFWSMLSWLDAIMVMLDAIMVMLDAFMVMLDAVMVMLDAIIVMKAHHMKLSTTRSLL